MDQNIKDRLEATRKKYGDVSQKHINTGFIKGDIYNKNINTQKAVLWKGVEGIKEPCLSIPPNRIDKMKQEKIKSLEFKDGKKGIVYKFDFDEVLDRMRLRIEGQEEQWYFPLSIAQKIDL